MQKKGAELSMNVIIIAAIALVVLVILVVLVLDRTGPVVDQTKCFGGQGTCESGDSCPSGENQVAGSCGEGAVCCVKIGGS